MSRRSTDTLTRRRYLAAGGATLAGLLAGCTSGPGTTTTDTTIGDPADTTTGKSYASTLAPVGDVTLDGPPESVFTIYTQYTDMAVALGYGDAVNAMYVPEMAGTTMNHYYDRLDGVSFDWRGLPDPLANGVSREQLHALDSDIHLADPAYVITQKNWDRDEVESIADGVAPWFGNFYSGTRTTPPAPYADAYEFYDLWTLFERVARLFGERDRYERIAAVHADLLDTIESNLPPEDERPTAVRVTLSGDTFYTYHLNEPGYWLADTRPLGARDAFAEEDWTDLWGSVGYETMLDADPDVILHLWGMTPNYDMRTVRETLRSHPAGKTLTAVRNDRVYAHGMRYQGPIMNLFQLEMTAKQLYPDVFGEWPAYTDGQPYPDIPTEEQLFDRDRLANAVTS